MRKIPISLGIRQRQTDMALHAVRRVGNQNSFICVLSNTLTRHHAVTNISKYRARTVDIKRPTREIRLVIHLVYVARAVQ